MKTKDTLKAIEDLQSKKRSKPVTFQSFKPLQEENKRLKEDNERLIAALKVIAFDSTCVPYKVAKEALTLHETIY